MRNAVAIVCFFASGFAGLVYEVCWIRTAALVFGSTTAALSTVLAVFFGGLAIGGVVAGRLARRTTRPLRVYALVEVALALTALATPALFAATDALYGSAYRALPASPAFLASIRVALVAIVLLPPTVLMGATLPLFCRHFVASPARIARSVGRLYAVNTLGAAAGCAAAGFFLIPAIGVRRSILVAAGISVAAGVAAAALRMAACTTDAAPPRPARSIARSRLFIGVLFFLSGAVAIGTQVVWTRFLALLVPNTVHTYTLTLTVVLLGIVLGSFVASFLFDRAIPRALSFGALQVLTGLAVLTLLSLPATFWQGGTGRVGISFILLLPAAILSGATFPLAIRMVLDHPALASVAVGVMTGVNTVGGIAGALLVGFLVLPVFGLDGTVRALTGASLAIGVGAWIGLGPLGSRRLAVAAGIVAVGAWVGIPLATGTRLPADFLGDPTRLIDYREGTVSNMAVVRSGNVIQLEIDRWWQGENRKNHQFMAAHVPAMIHPAPKSVLVIGVGTGQTPSRFLQYGITRLDCVDIEPALFEFVRGHFDAAWMEDERVRLVDEDGRNYLAHTDQTYDIVSLEIGQLFRPGVASFYTADFYHRASERVNAGGVLAQFVPLTFLSVDELRRVLASFVDAFPQSVLWYNTAELLLIGIKADRVALDDARLARLLNDPVIETDLRYGYWGGREHWLNRIEVLLAGYLCGPNGLAGLIADATPYRDDHPVLDYSTSRIAPDDRLEIANVHAIRAHLDPVAALLPGGLPAAQAANIDRVRDANMAAMLAEANLRLVEIATPPLAPDRATALLIEALAANPHHFASNRQMADTLAQAGRLEEAKAYFEIALQLRPDDAQSHRGLAFIHLQARRPVEAIPHLTASLAGRPDDATTHNYMGAALAGTGDLAGAVRHFHEAVRLRPGDAQLRNNLARAERDLRARPSE